MSAAIKAEEEAGVTIALQAEPPGDANLAAERNPHRMREANLDHLVRPRCCVIGAFGRIARKQEMVGHGVLPERHGIAA